VTLPGETAPTHPGSIDRTLDFVDHKARNLYAGRSGSSQCGAPCASNEELDAELFLQIADLPRQRGLGDAKTFRCCAECRFVGNADDVPELSKVHDDVPATGAEAANVCRVSVAR